MGKFIDKTGERFITNEGYEIKIIEYNNNSDVWIEFQDKYKFKKKVYYCSCVNGKIKNPFHPSVFQKGYIGIGEYRTTVNGKHTKEYAEWYNMIKRGYDEEFKKKRPTYKDVTVDEYFHNFQDFAEWWHNNYYEVEGEQMNLDKDILYKGNKVYAPDKCVFVPQRINTLFVKCDNSRGNLPIGVTYHRPSNKYKTVCNTLDGCVSLGYYNSPEQAFLVYKEFKEAYIKEVADEYKDKIPQRLYDAMYAWEVEIDD